VKVIVFGDSIATGQYLPCHKGWVVLMSAALEGKAHVTNASANGRTSRQALEAMPFEVQQHKPDVLIVQFGINDANSWDTDNGMPRVCLKSFEANLGEIVTRGLAFGAEVVFLNTNHPTSNPHWSEYNEVIKRVGEMFDDQVELVDMTEGFDGFFLLDSVHLNAAGHKWYAKRMTELVEKC
jgi:lysophospholipase L1-like esterase